MKVRFTVLSKSAKHGNKCVAGILKNGHFFRIVSSDELTNGAIPNDYLKNIVDGLEVEVLDEIQVKVIEHIPDNIQTENWLVDLSKKPKIVGHTDINEVIKLVKNNSDPYVYVNTARYLTKENVQNANGSLMFVIVENLQIKKAISFGKRRSVADFSYNGNVYTDISLTDPDYFSDENPFYEKAALFVSLANKPFENSEGIDRYYKFIAKIFPL